MLWKPQSTPLGVPAHKLRWLRAEDAPRILEIDRASYRGPLTLEVLAERMADRTSSSRVLVLDDPAVIAGFVLYSLRRPVLLIDRLAVHPTYRRFGLGRSLVESLPTSQRTPVVVALVKGEDLAAMDFARAVGFRGRRYERRMDLWTLERQARTSRGEVVTP